MNSGCVQSWTRDADGIWHGSVDPLTCVIFSERRQTTIRIGSDSYYQGSTYGTSERGFDEAMSLLWGSEPGEYIAMTRCASPRCAEEVRQLTSSAE